ncbi:transcription factor TFIIH complex subunit Rad15 [Catenaria anguillulae PL171]|uniref:DNA 5'-3' helicase n=1 Tax=Catenaria anguillulae PL171 TaxID=765915 RepID=A0A1Y2HL13_9FUNG|nr:transcription factor TFIIH complex subunit Rad15 [Catenaria anguillulae PL171]
MKLDIDGLEVLFPYEYIYPEQYQYMCDMKQVIDKEGACLLEMPSGTGKTVSLLSLIVSYIMSPMGANRKLVYCSRTVPEIEKALLELKRLMDYRTDQLGGKQEQFFALGLSSRKNLCVNPDVVKEKWGKAVDAKCRSLTASWVRRQAKEGGENTKADPKSRAKVTRHGKGAAAAGTAAGGSSNSGSRRRSRATSATASPATSSNSSEAGHNNNDDDDDDEAMDVDSASDSEMNADQSSTTSPQLCTFFEGLENADDSAVMPAGVYTIEELRTWGQANGMCPYFLSRRMIPMANVIIYSYHYLLDPKVAELVSKDLPKDAIVVFDEAHNIDNVCLESMSVDITRKVLDSSATCVAQLSDRIAHIKRTDAEKLRAEYDRLVEGLRGAAEARDANDLLGNPVLPDDVLEGAVPGNIRKAEHFVAFLRRFIEYLKTRLRVQHVVAETPASFLQHLRETTCIERKPLQFCAERLSSLVRTLEITDIDKFSELNKVAMFGTLVATYAKGFMLILEPFESDTSTVSNPIFHLTCLDASYAIQPVFKRFSSVIITSGTLSPLDMYPQILQFTPVLSKSYQMSLTRDCFLPLVITRGSDQVAISSKFEVRNEPAVVRNFGQILIQLAATVPDGIVCFFPSYLYMESIVTMWNGMKLLDEVWRHKLIFVETPDATETAVALENYRAACDNGRGAVLLSVARGKVSEGIDFDHNYGRAVVMFGIPYQYTESRTLKARLEYLRNEFNIRENDFLTFDALRHAAQCVGRVLRGKTDYGLMIFADKRYSRADKRAKLPPWMSHKFKDSTINCSTDLAIATAKSFLRAMAQPFDPMSQLGSSLWTIEHVKQHLQQSLRAQAVQDNLVDEVGMAMDGTGSASASRGASRRESLAGDMTGDGDAMVM